MKKVNLVLVLLFGSAVGVASTTTINGALAMGIATAMVMLLSALVMRLFDKNSIITTVLVTTVVTCAVDMLMNAFLPNLYAASGMYIALLACNLLTYTSVKKSVGDIISAAIVFAAVLVVIGAVRQFAGEYITILTKESGGLILYAFAAALVNKFYSYEGGNVEDELGFSAKEGE